MCGHCGCQANDQAQIEKSVPHRLLHLQQRVLAKNDRGADHNRDLFRHLLAVNVLSSPGAGKTTLIQRLLGDRLLMTGANSRPPADGPVRAGAIVGDLATERDAQRLRQTGAPVVQITTGTLCHLEADIVAQAAQPLDLAGLNLLVIENVGNLVCPAAYDLGEDLRLVLMSVTEGEDKPLKYPTMFKSADAVILSKMDIAEAVGFNRDEAVDHLQAIAPQARIFELSAVTGAGLADFYAYLSQAMGQKQPSLTVRRSS
ncbi:hydrogenase accessory protein HypB [filamentous cyanobacterium CCP5]|nr:hydrogenase accessory protein HypB [filamentous cyanobacterium CCP5]